MLVKFEIFKLLQITASEGHGIYGFDYEDLIGKFPEYQKLANMVFEYSPPSFWKLQEKFAIIK